MEERGKETDENKEETNISRDGWREKAKKKHRHRLRCPSDVTSFRLNITVTSDACIKLCLLEEIQIATKFWKLRRLFLSLLWQNEHEKQERI